MFRFITKRIKVSWLPPIIIPVSTCFWYFNKPVLPVKYLQTVSSISQKLTGYDGFITAAYQLILFTSAVNLAGFWHSYLFHFVSSFIKAFLFACFIIISERESE